MASWCQLPDTCVSSIALCPSLCVHIIFTVYHPLESQGFVRLASLVCVFVFGCREGSFHCASVVVVVLVAALITFKPSMVLRRMFRVWLVFCPNKQDQTLIIVGDIVLVSKYLLVE